MMTSTASLPAALPFVKMHGLGNDFVVVDAAATGTRVTPALARAVGDRHRGVGFDQLAEILPSDQADLKLLFWNSDGSLSGACGNATRCVAERAMAASGKDEIVIETERGLLPARRAAGGLISVNMGQPQLDWREVPLARNEDLMALPLPGTPAAVGMGNPHCITVVDDVAAIALEDLGRTLEHDPLFPERTNVEFIEKREDGSLRLRVWERGAGVTLACGSGACAAAVAAHKLGLTGPTVEIELDGGWLTIDWREDGVWMTGPTAEVFAGTLSPAFLAAAA